MRWNLIWKYGEQLHACVGKLTTIGTDNGFTHGRRQAIIRTNAGILLIGPSGMNFSEILKRNSNILVDENALENVVCETLSIFPVWMC